MNNFILVKSKIKIYIILVILFIIMKLAFLFMIYDCLEKEDLWFEFFNNAPSDKYTIYIHGKDKNNIKFKNDFFNKFIIEENYETMWGDFSLVYLQNKLIEYALSDKDNFKFIFMSGTHIPLHDFNFIYDKLINISKSHIPHFIIDNTNNSFIKRFNSINNTKKYNVKNWVYSSQWVILNKVLAEFIIKKEEEFNKIFTGSIIPDEYAYINYFRENKLDNQIINAKTTFISSVPSLNKEVYRKWPHTFDNNEINEKLIKEIKKSYLFMRKVVSTCNIDPNWIFNQTSTFSLNNKQIKLNKESYGNKNYEPVTNLVNTNKIKKIIVKKKI